VTAPLLTRVVAPRATVPVHSLIRAAVTNLDGETGWERGLTYAPESPGGYRAFAACTDAEYEDAGVGTTPVVTYRPWDLQVLHPCHSTFGLDEVQLDDELTRAMDTVESFAIARELWNGDLTRAAADAGDVDAPNLSLVDDPTVLNGGTPASPKLAVGLLEREAGYALRGQQAYLHVDRLTQQYLGHDLTREGNLITTRVGNLVVADAGYPGTPPVGVAPAPGVGWLYATGPVVVRRSPIERLGINEGALDTATNTLDLRSTRVVAATFDRAALFAVAVDLTA
jgi:hypothetical protein